MNLFVTRYFIAVVFIVLILQLAFSFTAAYNREHENKLSMPKQVVFCLLFHIIWGCIIAGSYDKIVLCNGC